MLLYSANVFRNSWPSTAPLSGDGGPAGWSLWQGAGWNHRLGQTGRVHPKPLAEPLVGPNRHIAYPTTIGQSHHRLGQTDTWHNQQPLVEPPLVGPKRYIAYPITIGRTTIGWAKQVHNTPNNYWSNHHWLGQTGVHSTLNNHWSSHHWLGQTGT